MKTPSELNRRQFLGKTASGVAGVTVAIAVPSFVPASALGGDDQPAPSDRVVIGSIGTGDLGRRHHLANMLLPNNRVEVAAVCDVDQIHREQAAQLVLDRTGRRVGIYEDFRDLLDRKDIDAVLIATPDHWHALVAIYAMEAGKDVYCEKPLTLTIDESKAMVAAARRYGSVLQTGSQQRSDSRFRQACELVRNGKIGKLTKVTTHIGGIDAGQWQPPQTPPPNLNWNLWLGPAPYADYSPNRCHYQFRWFFDYSGGKMTDWGAHHNDIALWGIGLERSGPNTIEGKLLAQPIPGGYTAASDYEITYTYANGVEHRCVSTQANTIYGSVNQERPPKPGELLHGVKFEGPDGWIYVTRGKIEASRPEILSDPLPANKVALYVSTNHMGNFFECLRSRKPPICEAEIGHRSVSVCHLGVIALRLGRKLNWDPAKEEFVGDKEANTYLAREMRKPWGYEMIS